MEIVKRHLVIAAVPHLAPALLIGAAARQRLCPHRAEDIATAGRIVEDGDAFKWHSCEAWAIADCWNNYSWSTDSCGDEMIASTRRVQVCSHVYTDRSKYIYMYISVYIYIYI